jgi:hypothetical protein
MSVGVGRQVASFLSNIGLEESGTVDERRRRLLMGVGVTQRAV